MCRPISRCSLYVSRPGKNTSKLLPAQFLRRLAKVEGPLCWCSKDATLCILGEAFISCRSARALKLLQVPKRKHPPPHYYCVHHCDRPLLSAQPPSLAQGMLLSTPISFYPRFLPFFAKLHHRGTYLARAGGVGGGGALTVRILALSNARGKLLAAAPLDHTKLPSQKNLC